MLVSGSVPSLGLPDFFLFTPWVKSRNKLDEKDTLRQSNIAMENEPFEDVFPIKNVDIPLLC